MASITVQFETDYENVPEFPVTVENIEKHLLPPEDRDGDSDWAVLDVTVGEVIDEAQAIVESAPGFDHVELDRLWQSDVSASVTFQGVK